MKNSKIASLICGLLVITATVAFYCLTFNSIFAVPMRWVSLTILLFTECIVTLKAMLIKQSIITQAVVLTGGAHLSAVLILSLVFLCIFPFALKAYILLNVLLLCVLAAVDTVIIHFAKNISVANKKLTESQAVMDGCYSKAQSLVAVYGDSAHKDALLSIAELIKYSDNSVLTDDEVKIMCKLDELEARLSASEDATDLIAEIKNIINLRSIKMKSIKRGDY